MVGLNASGLRETLETVFSGKDLVPHVRNNALGGMFDGGLDLKGAVAGRSFGRFLRRQLGLRVGLWIRDYHAVRNGWRGHGKLQFSICSRSSRHPRLSKIGHACRSFWRVPSHSMSFDTSNRNVYKARFSAH
jgi:hypothetical protein